MKTASRLRALTATVPKHIFFGQLFVQVGTEVLSAYAASLAP